MAGKNDRGGRRGHGFNTFAGVFTPTILTIFGVIMFLRSGYVVGQAGIRNALIILAVSQVISLLTCLSLSAIATNVKVKGGGAYFLISRSLGTEFGGSIGVALYLAQAVSVSLYIIGFTEAFCATFSSLAPYATSIAVSVCLVLFVVTFVGASWAIRVQFIVLAALVVSIVSFFIGGFQSIGPADFWKNVGANWGPAYSAGMNFWLVFAIYFPAVTGIMAGVSMSGDLADPQRSLPLGSLSAVIVSIVVYAAQVMLLGGCCLRSDLVGNSMILKDMSIWGPLIDIGIWAATLSSALGSFVGAPRVLQALARDKIFESLTYFSVGAGEEDEPRRATVLTFGLALACIMLGDLNVIAPIITMFFLITYGMVNFACFYESRTLNPSFRPRFRAYSWFTAFIASIACVFVMFLVSKAAAFLSLMVLFGLYKYIEHRRISSSWGDAKSGYVFRRAVDDLSALEGLKYHPKNWRPQILVLSGNPKTRPRLVELADKLECGRGLLIVANVIVGEFKKLVPRRASQEESIRSYLAQEGIGGFVEVVVADSFENGFLSLAQSAGIGKLKPNSVLLGWCENEDAYKSYATNIRRAVEVGLDVLVYRHEDAPIESPGRIDVWWRGRENGNLMVIFAYLLTLNRNWDAVQLRILRIIANEAGADDAHSHLKDLLHDARVDGEICVIVSSDTPYNVIHRESREADLVFLGMETPREGEECEFMERTQQMTSGLKNVVLVKSTGRSDITV